MNAWIIVNSMITSWILNVIEPRRHASTDYADLAPAIWESIQKRYSVPNMPKVHQLKAKIASCKQGNLKVVDFFNKRMGLWNELENCVKRPNCNYGAMEKYVKLAENDKAHQFLMGLDDDAYSNIWSQILALDPLPLIDRIYSMVQQKENHKKVMVA